MDRPSSVGRLAPSRLKLWRALKLNELFKALIESREPGRREGTPQRKGCVGVEANSAGRPRSIGLSVTGRERG